MKLNDQFSMVRANILMMVPLPDVNQVYRMAAQEESHKDFCHSNQNETLAFVSDKKKSDVAKPPTSLLIQPIFRGRIMLLLI